MNARIAWCSGLIVASALLCASAWAEPAAGVKAKLEESMSPGDAMDAKDKPGTSAKAAKSTAESRIFRFKGEKKASLGEAPALALVLEDALTGKSETIYVPNADPAKYGPVAEVADAMKEIKPGDLVEVRTDRQKGKTIATSLSKAEFVRGEDRPKGYVFVGWDRKKNAKGETEMALRLKKFGREAIVMVPLTLNRDTGDWNPSRDVEYVLGRVQPGEAVEADIKPGKPPVLEKIYEYYRPERGKFVGLGEMDFNGYTALAVEMVGNDGTKLRIRLPGTEQYKNGKRIMMPDPAQVAMIRRIKPDSEIEVFTRTRNDYVLREISVISPPDKKAGKEKSESAKSDKAAEKSASAK